MAAARRALLLHGLWMPPLAMRRFAARLRTAGFTTGIIGYRSIFGSTDAAATRCARGCAAATDASVGHSSGLMALQALQAEPRCRGARVCLHAVRRGAAACCRAAH